MKTAPAAISPQDHSAAWGGGRWLLGQTGNWLATEGARWIFVAKAMLAAFGALWLAFRLGLDSPGTAMTTTVILALPSSGMVLEKAFYRLLGTLVGCAAALVLVALCPQNPPLLFLGLALWIAVCTGGASMYRNQQSYSFVLAGYTACMIAMPAIDAPSAVFVLAVTRMTEVGLGILVASVVHDVVFPRRHSRTVMLTVHARYAGFIDFVRQVLEHRMAPADTELHHLKFAADIAALESGRAAAFFEAGHARAHTQQLHAFNGAFMAVLTTFYTLHRLMHRMRGAPAADATTAAGATAAAAATAADNAPVLALLEPIYTRVAAAMMDELNAARLEQMRTGLARDIAAAREQLAAGPALARIPQISFDTAVELLERFVRDLTAFASSYHGLTQQKRQQLSDPGAYTPKTPAPIVLASGFRAACALLLTASFWYWTAWPYAPNVLLMATIFCALSSSSPRPTAMVKQVLIGFVICAPLSFCTEFLLVARADDFATLVLAALPVFALGSYLSSGAKWGGVGVGISMFASTLVVPVNRMHYDVESFLGSELSLVMGVALAYLVFSVLLPEHTMGQKDHVAAALWRQARHVCTASMYRLTRRFDNRVRDLLNQLNAATGGAPDAAARAVVRHGLTLLELGHAVIELRQLIATSQPGPVPDTLKTVVRQLAIYLDTPSRASGEATLQAILQAGPAVREAMPQAEAQRKARLQRALADLHSIYTSLLDQLPQLPSTGESDHAA